ncbi:hypothetical protein [Candidatus Palauibacter polyketidifaciens]|uniref:hypothetical protein n=1 Tax=Candidatus Palauibacter polyketidifaciens TaxID=3056740 RepID=UPI0023A42E26|nr:hypothetical protein [Candidatus Palauibacter polyketidifaciens]MDE2721628.1 hypothetical protein [Candidatus Palauibacter polyketidifaciens]
MVEQRRVAAGDELFSFRFDMPNDADSDGRASFAFALPAEPRWGERLASVTLSGPGGSATDLQPGLDVMFSRGIPIPR